jgi:acetyl-CoA C-acetyltransferase
VVDIVNQKLLQLDGERVNAHGGSVALGHPLGATGAILVVRLLNVLRARGGRYGCAAICNGGGGASALVLEVVEGGGGSSSAL